MKEDMFLLYINTIIDRLRVACDSRSGNRASLRVRPIVLDAALCFQVSTMSEFVWSLKPTESHTNVLYMRMANGISRLVMLGHKSHMEAMISDIRVD